MSWNQDYSVPSVESLFEKLTGKSSFTLLREELERQGILLEATEDVLLTEGMYQEIKGKKYFYLMVGYLYLNLLKSLKRMVIIVLIFMNIV